MNHNALSELTIKTTRLIVILIATTYAGSPLPPADAEDTRTHQIPLAIKLDQLTITDEDVDQAAKFCLIKEGALKQQATNTKKPTPAQAVVTTTICN